MMKNNDKGFTHIGMLVLGIMIISAIGVAGMQVAKHNGSDLSGASASINKSSVRITAIKVITPRKINGHKEGKLWCADTWVGFKVITRGSVDWVSVNLLNSVVKRYYTDTSGNTDPISVPNYAKNGDYTPWSLIYRSNNTWGDDDGYYYNHTREDVTTDNAYQYVKACTEKRGKAVNVTAYGYLYAYGPGGHHMKKLPKTFVRIR